MNNYFVIAQINSGAWKKEFRLCYTQFYYMYANATVYTSIHPQVEHCFEPTAETKYVL